MILRIVEKIILWLLRAGAIFSLTSLLLYSDSFFFPYIVPRVVFFQIITSGLFVLSVILISFFAHHRRILFSSTVFRVLLIYFLIAGITTLSSADVEKSFIGTLERSLGFYNLLHFGFFFMAVRLAFQEERWRKAFLIISTIPALYISLDFLKPTLLLNQPAHSTVMGNPVFLGGYLIVQIFFALYLFTASQKKWVRALWASMGILLVFTLFATNVRGAMLGFGMGFIYCVFAFFWKHKNWRTVAILVFFLFIASYSLLYSNRNHRLIRNNFIVQRITNVSSQDATLQARLTMWKIAWKGFLEKPLLGWGRENYSLVFNLYYDPAFEKTGVGEKWEDRAHSIFFDELVMGGVLGLISYLAVLGVVLWKIRGEILFVALLIAYTAQNAFGIENINSLMVFIIFLALADFQKSDQNKMPMPSTAKKPSYVLASGVSALAFVTITLITYSFTIQPAIAVIYFQQTIVSMVFDQFSDFEKFYEKGKRYSKPFPSRTAESINVINIFLPEIALRFQDIEKSYPLYTHIIRKDLEELIERNPAEQRWRLGYIELLIHSAVAEKNPLYLDQAQEELGKLLAVSPSRDLFMDIARYALSIRKTHFMKL